MHIPISQSNNSFEQKQIYYAGDRLLAHLALDLSHTHSDEVIS